MKLLPRFIRSIFTPQAKVGWWVPYWFHVASVRKELAPVLNLWSIARVSIVTALVGAVIVVGAKFAFPMIMLPPWWLMLLGLPTIYGALLLMLVIHLLIPSHVEVRKARIHVMTGQTHWLVKSDQIHGTRIVVFADDRVRLRVLYYAKGRNRARVIGVAQKVDLEQLANLLPVAPEIWDARGRCRSGIAG